MPNSGEQGTGRDKNAFTTSSKRNALRSYVKKYNLFTRSAERLKFKSTTAESPKKCVYAMNNIALAYDCVHLTTTVFDLFLNILSAA
jgi:hypothetical protein